MNVYSVTGGPKARLLGTVLGHDEKDALKRAQTFWPTSMNIKVRPRTAKDIEREKISREAAINAGFEKLYGKNSKRKGK
jgi:hypothetical protein